MSALTKAPLPYLAANIKIDPLFLKFKDSSIKLYFTYFEACQSTNRPSIQQVSRLHKKLHEIRFGDQIVFQRQ